MHQCLESISTRRSLARKGGSSRRGAIIGMSATQFVGEQEVIMIFTRCCTAVSNTKPSYMKKRRLVPNTREHHVVRDGGDPIDLDVSTSGFPARVMNNSEKPNVYVCRVTAGFGLSQEEHVFLLSMRNIAAGEELFYESVISL